MAEQYFVHVSFLKIGKKELWELRSLEKRTTKQHNNDEEIINQIISNAEKKIYNKEVEKFNKRDSHAMYEIAENTYDYIHRNELSLFDSKIELVETECVLKM
ncbi:hypothetical protein ACMHYP_23035 [Bacillus cereus]|uniref:hypothetical protein n=1 Tax=Bacillus cereus TaxID=1396 RepID=UPI0039C4930C